MTTDHITLRLFTSDDRALTGIESADESISLPHEIHLRADGLGTVKACPLGLSTGQRRRSRSTRYLNLHQHTPN